MGSLQGPVIAEGGTAYDHAVTVARARNIAGPYELHPQNPILTSRGDAGLALQKAGHASLVETQSGEWYLAHLVGRPVGRHRRCVLGRETALQRIYWHDDGWPRLATGGRAPAIELEGPLLPTHPFPSAPARHGFDSLELPLEFQSLRIPIDETWLTLRERPGWLRLRGRESLCSLHAQSLVARRIESWHCMATTRLEFQPESFQQLAGLTAFYDTRKWYYICITHDDGLGRVVQILECDDGKYSELLGHGIPVTTMADIWLRATINLERLQFAISDEGTAWRNLGVPLDVTRLSDEYGEGYSFTGAFFGLCAQDLSGRRCHADFDFFEYQDF